MLYNELPDSLRMEFKFASLMSKISYNGIKLNIDLAKQYLDKLNNELDALDIKLLHKIPRKEKELKPLTKIYKQDGALNHHAEKWRHTGKRYLIDETNGIMRRFEIEEPNLNFSGTWRDYLLYLGWVPSEEATAWNFKTKKNIYGKAEKIKDSDGRYIKSSPKLPTSDEEIEELSRLSPDFQLVADRLVRFHRRNSIRGYLENVRSDGRISMIINGVGTNTHRVSHKVVANVPRVESFFGKEMRSLFTCDKGNVIVGCDATGLEMRVCAHYLNSPEFTKELLIGDVHKKNAEALKEYVTGKPTAKGILYAMLYGGGDVKLGSLCDNTKRKDLKNLGSEVRSILNKTVPNLEDLTNKLKTQFKKTGGIVGIDGRFIQCRKEYALLNTLFQSAGTIIMKYATCKQQQELNKL